MGEHIEDIIGIKLSNDEMVKFMPVVTSVETSLMTIRSQVIKNPNLCRVCLIKKYVDLSLNWEMVISTIKTLRDFKGDISSLIYEFLLATYFSQIANEDIELIQTYGAERIKLMNLKDPSVDPVRLFGLMMNLFIKTTLNKVLDKFIKVVYDMHVDGYKTYRLLDFLLQNITVSAGRFVHSFDEKTLSGNVVIRKCSSYNSEGLACEEPLIVEYTVSKKGTSNE